MSKDYSHASPKSDNRFSGIDAAIREAIESLNRTDTAELSALF
jgi:hypothetical protein